MSNPTPVDAILEKMNTDVDYDAAVEADLNRVTDGTVANELQADFSGDILKLKNEFSVYYKHFVAARDREDEEAMKTLNRKMTECRLELKNLVEFNSLWKQAEPGNSESAATHMNESGGGLTLNRRDLPKFQLASSALRPFGEHEEVFESVAHFIKTFENVIASSSQNIERVWWKYLPLCLPSAHTSWVESDLKACKNWEEVKKAFNKNFSSLAGARRHVDEVFTMKMDVGESISDYTARFLQTVYSAGLNQHDLSIGNRFLTSLLRPVRMVARLALYRSDDKKKQWTAEQISEAARDIFGDDEEDYAEMVGSIPGLGAKRPRSSPRAGVATTGSSVSQPVVASAAHSVKKPRAENLFRCSHHGPNKTHDTVNCFTLKNKKSASSAVPGATEKKNKECFHCHAPNWTPAHHCEKKSVLNVRLSEDEEATAQAIERDVDVQMNEASMECKLNNTEANEFNLTTPILIEGKLLLGKVDSGSDVTCIKLESFSKKLKLNKIHNVSGSLQFLTSSDKRVGKSDLLSFKYANGIAFKHAVEIVKFDESFDFDVLLGKDILPKLGIALTGVAFRIEELYKRSDNPGNDDQMFKSLNIDNKNQLEPDNSPAGSSLERDKFLSMIQDCLDLNQDIPVTAYCSMPEAIVELPTDKNATAYRRQYPVPQVLKKVLDEQIQKWLDADVIERSSVNTRFNAPLLLIPKKAKDGSISGYRVCMDVRMLNRILPPAFNYQNKNIKDILSSFKGACVFSTLDLSEAFLKCPVQESDKHKLTFTHNGLQYCFKRACFGLSFMTSFFSKLMSILFADMTDIVKFYVDDICIASSSLEEHARDVKRVIERITSVNLILQPKKCVWFQRSVRLLGFVIDEKGMRVDDSKVTNVAAWPIPTTGKQVQQFCGLVNYVREFVPMISRLSEPISNLSNIQDISTYWTSKHTECFNAIKKILQSNMILHYPDLTRKFYVATDASQYAVGAVLFQRDDDGRDKFVSFISSTLVHSQRRWSTTKRELYALVLALQKFRTYLWGRHFTVYTDHKALVYLHTQKIANPMMIGWLETLLDYDFDVIHIPGLLNKLPDVLSRLYPPLDESDYKLEENKEASKAKINNKKALIKRKRYSKDKSVNVLTMNVIENKSLPVEYMTPPDEERDALLREVHTFGHFGVQAIVKEIHSKGLHWTNLYDEANELVKSCVECQRHNVSKRGYHPLTNVVAFRPFDHVAMDLAGPLPVTDDGEVYMLVLVDICTKYIILRALKNKQSDTIAKAIVSICGDYGFFRVCQSDNGLEFRNVLQHKMSKSLGIDRRYTTPYHPRGNGAAEASVKIAINTVRKMVKSNGKDWAHFLPICQLAINNSIKSRTESSPFSLMYARRVNLPDDYANTSKFPLPKEMMTPKELEDRIEIMEKVVFPAIKERTSMINKEYKKKFDGSKKLIDIPVGTHVMVRLQHRPSKLAPLYDGPYTVVRKNKGGSYELKDEQNELLHRNYVPSELKVVNLDESQIDETYYTVENIREHRGKPGNWEFLVKWAGYGERENTWQKAKDFSDQTIIDKYWDKVSREKKNSSNTVLSNKRQRVSVSTISANKK